MIILLKLKDAHMHNLPFESITEGDLDNNIEVVDYQESHYDVSNHSLLFDNIIFNGFGILKPTYIIDLSLMLVNYAQLNDLYYLVDTGPTDLNFIALHRYVKIKKIIM